MQALREWLLTVTAIVSLVSLSVSAVMAAREYKLKVRAEDRQRIASQAETDVKIAQLFAQLLQTAEGRTTQTIHSDTAVEQLFARGMVPDDVASNPRSLSAFLRDSCAFIPLSGETSQVAAIMSVAVLGSSYKSLERPALAGLTNLRKYGIASSTVDVAFELLSKGADHDGNLSIGHPLSTLYARVIESLSHFHPGRRGFVTVW
jgi:hypothetical protein